MEYRRPSSDDFEQMVLLQNKNLVSVLNSSEKADGFLSGAFSAEEFKAMDEDLCVLICSDNKHMCGYLCVSSIESNKNVPLVVAMVKCFPHIKYQEKLLKDYNIAIAGPVCIDKEYRGQGILLNLYNTLPQFLVKEHPELDLYAVLISASNQRSVNAHKKLGMKIVGEYEYENNIYLILVSPINK